MLTAWCSRMVCPTQPLYMTWPTILPSTVCSRLRPSSSSSTGCHSKETSSACFSSRSSRTSSQALSWPTTLMPRLFMMTMRLLPTSFTPRRIILLSRMKISKSAKATSTLSTTTRRTATSSLSHSVWSII